MGALYLIRKYWPSLPVHASTQMTIHDSAGARFLQKQGVERVILARELSYPEIKAIKQDCQVELEVFVHGALCVAYSGACLFSSLIGGRSGNRGRCAQPCRLTYTLLQDGQELATVATTGEHLLSPKDLCLLPSLPQLIEAGVSSLKIEGRMKSPEYVGTVIKNYREALDRFAESPERFAVEPGALKELESVFNRGLCTGYFTGDLGPDLMSPVRPSNRGRFVGRVKEYDGKRRRVLVSLEEEIREGDGLEIWVKVGGRVGTIVEDLRVGGEKRPVASAGTEARFSLPDRVRPGDRVFLTSSHRLQEEIEQMKRNDYPAAQQPCTLKVQIAPGQPLTLALSALGKTVTVTSPERATEAEKHPLTEETLKKHLTRMGATPFRVAEFTAVIEGRPIMPFSQLNQVRREAVALLEREILSEYHHQPLKIKTTVNGGEETPHAQHRRGDSFLTVYAGTLDILKQALKGEAVQKVIFGGESFVPGFSWNEKSLNEAVSLVRARGVRAVIALPRITRERERKRNEDYLRLCQRLEPDGILIAHLGSLQMVKDFTDLPVYTDHTLPIFNTYALAFLRTANLKGVTLSPELSRKELFALFKQKEFQAPEVELLVFGALELMVSQFCPIGAWVGNQPPRTCPRPCRQNRFSLRDRKGYVFPVMTDEFCRMHLLNSRCLSLYRELGGLKELKLSLRLELRHQSPAVAGQIIALFQEGLAMEVDQRHESALEVILGQGLTRGHFYRGVE
ncbi:MAG: U32 family peptidase [Firmicutes bacterium]|nr:U32 family peptidase [Bacillota bacterium]